MIGNVKQRSYDGEKGDSMATAPTQIRIDANVKREANALFKNLGLDISSAVNLFLHQCILRGRLPFAVEIPQDFESVILNQADR